MSFLILLHFDLCIVCSSHLQAKVVLMCLDIRILDVVLDDVLKGEHVPCVVLLRLNMARCSLLNGRFTVIEIGHSLFGFDK